MSGMNTYKEQGNNEKKCNVENVVFDLRQVPERSQSFMNPLPPNVKI